MSPRVGRRACRSCVARSGSSPARSPPSPRRAVDQASAIMALVNRRSRRPSIDIWPGFVDALAQLLMVIIFILLVFTAGQFFLADALSGRDKALHELQQQVSELGNLLALERTVSADLRASAASLATQLKAKESERSTMAARAEQAEKALTGEQQTSAAARTQVEQLTASVAALREQLAQIAAALDHRQPCGYPHCWGSHRVSIRGAVRARQRRTRRHRKRPARPGDHRLAGDFAEDPARHQLGPADRCPYRPAADQYRAVPLELGALDGAGDIGRPLCDRQRHTAQPAHRRRLRRQAAARPRQQRGSLSPQPPDRDETHRALARATAPAGSVIKWLGHFRMAGVEWVQRFPNWDKIDQTPRAARPAAGARERIQHCRPERRRDEEVSTNGAS